MSSLISNNKAAVMGIVSNWLQRKELSKAFEDFQGHEELKDGLPHGLSESGALLLQSSTNSLHCYIYVISDLKGERRMSATLFF